ncbi:hypothetical protein KP509_17G027800 [Ceratopteris richardii]|uniref:Uncharacterized protein n=1 Tax=Ceratopteris richardii TaxID=49495 RepID=A0A8T2STQ9_CERRI|nr:hypothetical protein KP509_17G027800 [Ceratopteris richardii]
MSWIFSDSCSGPWSDISLPSTLSLFSQAQEWIAYILFSTCVQQSMSATIDLSFILVSAVINLKSRCQDKLFYRKSAAGLVFAITLFFAAILSVACTGITAFAIWMGFSNHWTNDSIRETVFSAVGAAAWITSSILLLVDKYRNLLVHQMPLRTWWFASSALSLLQIFSSAFRLSAASGLNYSTQIVVFDMYALARSPITFFFLLRALQGRTNLHPVHDGNEVHQPLIDDREEGVKKGSYIEYENTSAYAKAGFLSKLTFSWLDPMLNEGSKHALNFSDVPPLAPEDKAEHTFGMLQKTWSVSTIKRHGLTIALVKTFWRPLLLTALLQVLRTVIIYAGPMLISSFTTYANGERVSDYDGYALVFLLLIAKMIEVSAYHHFNFQSYKLGNNMRSAVITMIYRKALRLSSSSRQKHGIGQITNYMIVDIQQISDSCLQLHLLWCIPLQVILALALLWRDIGIPCLSGIVVWILISIFSAYNAKSQRSQMAEVTSLRDKRLRSITEVLQYMKLIKLEAWETKFQERVEACRKEEFNALTKFVVSTAESMFVLWNTVSLVSVFTFGTAILLDKGLTAGKVFTATSIFRIVQEPIRNFPNAIMYLSQLVISLERLNHFLSSSELDTDAVTKCLDSKDEPIVVEKGFFGWDDTKETSTLRDINLRIGKGSFVAVVGTVGSGKSSLLAALLGEMVKISGQASTAGSFAYVSQSAWIQNATIMDNILFGTELHPQRYEKVIQACGLRPDLDAMDYGDQTEIGEKGINLSGGQKQRIQLARAVYQDCDVYLLDDIFSAVDAHTGSHLFKECILELLKGKTVILVTHQVEFLKGADLVLVMREGTIIQSGKYEDVHQEGTAFAALVASHNESLSLLEESEQGLRQSGSGTSLHRKQSQRLGSEMHLGSSLKRNSQSQRSTDQIPISDTMSTSAVVEPSSRLIEEEQKEKGRVSWSMYWLYLTKAFGWGTVVVLLINQSSWQAFLIASDYWLAGEISEETINKKKFIIVYALLNLGAWIAMLVRVAVVAALGLKTAQLLFLGMLRSIFHAPMSFFDTTPSGRILSRFSSDQTNIDFILHFYLGGCLSIYVSTVGVIVVICISSWPIVFLVIPLGCLFYRYQKFYITSSREITRLDSITKAPLIYHLSETVAGIETIRCFRKQESFARENLIRTNTNMKMDFHNNSANEWLGIRLETMGTGLLCATAFLLVVLPSSIVKPETVGLALSYALSLNSGLFFAVFLSCIIENKMVSVERINQFTMIPSEAAFTIKDCLPVSLSWPHQGKIETVRLKLRYRPSTPLVLRGVTFTILSGEKVGVVGRTGSGKSTLLVAIFRLVEPCGGQILIDGIDITSLGLHDLRSKLGIIPQDPVLFEGTVRNNLDPLGIHSDEEIWRALDQCKLAQAVREKPRKLESSVTESGSNWSLGQRQLFCFGRALLKRGRILFLDEATASVDAQTDTIIQKLIRKEFKGSTVLSIAHRIPTVMDADKVLVMDAGRVKEFDGPTNLLLNSDSLFSSLVHEYSTRATRGH